MQDKSLVIIFTPLQFLNALAFKNQFSDKEYEFIVLTSEIINIKHIKSIDSDNLCLYPLVKFNFLNDEVLWIIKSLFVSQINIYSYDQVIIGNYNNIIGYFLALRFQKENKQIIYLDDGLATLEIYKERNQLHILKSSRLFGGRVNKLIDKTFYRKRILDTIYLYSSFELNFICTPKYDKIINQDNVTSYENKQIGNELWFIGSPLIENNYMTEYQFKTFINKVKSYAQNKGFIFKYILHRFERPKLEPDSLQFDLPIEVILKNKNVLPSEVISFYSSALVNIANLYSHIQCRYINLYKLNSNLKNLETVYEAFEHNERLTEFSI